MARIDASKLDLQEKVVHIGRVSKTVKGGRIYKFAALVVVGDGNGTIGFGIGKAGEVPDAIRKGIEDAKKNMVKVSLKGTTIPHEIIGKFGAGEVLMKPAPQGTGVIAGGAVRAVLEVAGISDIRTKCLRSNNPCNVVTATFEGLKALRTVEEVAAVRGKDAKELMSILGEAALSETDLLYAKFADEFEKQYVSQGYYTNRSIEETLDVGWQLLSILPVTELKRIKTEMIDKYLPKKDS